MNKFFISFIIGFACNASYAQNTAWPSTTGSENVGIGTINPTLGKLQISGTGDLLSLSAGGAQAQLNAYSSSDFRIIQRSNAPLTLWTNTIERFRIDPSGNIGVGLPYPQARMHILSNGSSSNSTAQYSGDLIVQAGSSGRSSINGASIEFVIPANTDGNNPWGQARIISVAGNESSYDATGKLIIGTRRMFDKRTGTGLTWNYGDDLVIDGGGKVGIGTTTPDAKLAVNGTIHTQEVKVDMNGWPDYVFKPTYKLPSLTSLKEYINENQHLPEMPSEAQVTKDGVNLGEMNKLLLKKVEELTLHMIHQQEEIEALKHVVKSTKHPSR